MITNYKSEYVHSLVPFRIRIWFIAKQVFKYKDFALVLWCMDKQHKYGIEKNTIKI